MNPVLQHIDNWLLKAQYVETDHGGEGHNYIGIEFDRSNRFDNILLSLNDDSVLAWYVQPFISGQNINESPYGHMLDPYLMQLNEKLAMGRWSRTESGDILFDVSVPLNGYPPPDWVLTRIYEICCDAADHMISRIRFFLQTGLTFADPSVKTYTDCINFVADDPHVLARLEALGLIGSDAAVALRRIMQKDASPWSEDLQAQTRQAIEELRVAPDGYLHFKHKNHGYRAMQLDDLSAGKLVLGDKQERECLTFDTVEGLLSAGWVID